MESENENQDANTSTYEGTFDNLRILKGIVNATNVVSDKEFSEIVPKEKSKKLFWITAFNCMKSNIIQNMMQVMNSMWSEENMNKKIEILGKQKEKFAELNLQNKAWRPQHSVKDQLRAPDTVCLLKQKALLEPLSKQYDERVQKLMKSVRAKRHFAKALLLDIQKYQKENEEIKSQICKKLIQHEKTAENFRVTVMDEKMEELIQDSYIE